MSARRSIRFVDVDRLLALAAKPARAASSNFYRDLLTRRDALAQPVAQPRPA